MDELLREFLSEGFENLRALDVDLVRLERTPDDAALLASIFRTVHSIKGTSGFLDLPRVERLAHAAEDVLARLRDGALVVTPATVDHLLATVERIGRLLDEVETAGREPPGDDVDLVAALAAVAETAAPSPPATGATADATAPVPATAAAPTLPVGRPLDALWGKLAALAHDLARRLDKTVAVETTGGEIAVDPALLRRLRAPLVHLVRNAVDHGIEPAAARRAAGKPAHGTLGLRAVERDGRLRLAITDDGRGLDPDAVAATALAQGHVTAAELADLAPPAKLELVFRPGFSTAPAVSTVSGRGVGMDVVRTGVAALGGRVALEAAPDRGTTVRLDLPTAPAGVTALVVTAGGERFAIPAAAVVDVLYGHEPGPRATGATTAYARPGAASLRRVRLAPEPAPDAESDGRTAALVVVRAADERIGVVVDGVVGTRELVLAAPAASADAGAGGAGEAHLADGARARLVDAEHLAQRSRSTVTGTWSEGFSQPRAARSTSASRTARASGGVTQTWSSRRPRSEADQSRAR